MSLREFVCVIVNIPSGLRRDKPGLEGVVDVQLSPCRNKLLVACEWPQSMTDSICTFDLQLQKIHTQNLLGSSSNLVLAAAIVLPFQVEQEMVVCETNLDKTICSVNI
jgi:hypothetical protein